MKNKIFLLIIIIVIVAGAIVYANKKCTCLVCNCNQNVTGNSVEMFVVPISESDNFFRINVEYPQFKNVDPAFNQKISNLITEEINNFKKNSKDNWEARKATATPDNPVPENPEEPFDFIATWTPTQLNNKYLSFVINIYYFTGGAHGVNEIYAFNYDLNMKKEISMLDFLNSSQDSLNKVAELSAQNITSQLQSNGMQANDIIKQMIQQGTMPTNENFQNFNFTYNSLIIYFQQYQVAPGSVGSITITLYKDILDSNSIKSDYLK